jgi:hypothetical protein
LSHQLASGAPRAFISLEHVYLSELPRDFEHRNFTREFGGECAPNPCAITRGEHAPLRSLPPLVNDRIEAMLASIPALLASELSRSVIVGDNAIVEQHKIRGDRFAFPMSVRENDSLCSCTTFDRKLGSVTMPRNTGAMERAYRLCPFGQELRCIESGRQHRQRRAKSNPRCRLDNTCRHPVRQQLRREQEQQRSASDKDNPASRNQG